MCYRFMSGQEGARRPNIWEQPCVNQARLECLEHTFPGRCDPFPMPRPPQLKTKCNKNVRNNPIIRQTKLKAMIQKKSASPQRHYSCDKHFTCPLRSHNYVLFHLHIAQLVKTRACQHSCIMLELAHLTPVWDFSRARRFPLLTFHQSSAVWRERVKITAEQVFTMWERLKMWEKKSKEKLFCNLLFICLIHSWCYMSFTLRESLFVASNW